MAIKDTLKKFANWFIVFLLGLLGLLFGVERWKRKKTEDKLEKTEDKLETTAIEKKSTETALENTNEVTEKIAEVERREDESKDDSHNNLVDAWNSDRM